MEVVNTSTLSHNFTLFTPCDVDLWTVHTYSSVNIQMFRSYYAEMGIGVPPELAQLYELYQQEIHAATYTESNDVYTPPYKLPPISTRLY